MCRHVLQARKKPLIFTDVPIIPQFEIAISKSRLCQSIFYSISNLVDLTHLKRYTQLLQFTNLGILSTVRLSETEFEADGFDD